MSASGPQAERLSQYTRQADLGYPEGRDELRGPAFAGREHALHTQLARMKTTVEHLQQVVQRQEIVINDYQIKYPSVSPNMGTSDPQDPGDPGAEAASVAGLPPWVSDPLLMSPLLVAYDERLGELQAANSILSEQISKLKLSHDEITKENTGLRSDLKNYVERMLAYTEGGGAGASATLIGGAAAGALGSSEQMNELVEMNDVLNKTNSIMSEQITMLESHLNASRTALTEAQEQLTSETKQSQEQAAALTQLSVLNRSLEMERDETVRRLQAATGDLAAMQQARDELQQVVRKNSQGTRAKDVQINELKAALGELSKAAGDDQDALEERLAAISDHARELKAALIQREVELDTTTTELRDLQQEHRSTRTDAEGMLKVMAGMEKNLAEFKAREDQTVNIARESKEKVEQAMLERDQALAREAQGRREIARLLEQRRTQASEAMDHEEASVESSKKRLMDQLAARDKNINELGAKCAELQAKMERAARDQRSAERERSALLDDVEGERKRLRATIDDFAARTKESVERRDNAEAQAQSTLQDLAEKEQEMAIARAELADRVTHLQERLADTTKQLSMKVADVKRLEADLRMCKATLAKERTQANDMRTTLQEEASKVTNTAAKRIAEIQASLDKAKRSHADGQSQTAALLAAHERRSSKEKRELAESLSTQQRLLREKVEECSRVNSRAVQLEQQLTIALSGQQDLEQQILRMSRTVDDAKAARKAASKKQKDTSARMSSLIAAEENRLRQLSENRMENARLSREVQRLETALGRKQARSPQRA